MNGVVMKDHVCSDGVREDLMDIYVSILDKHQIKTKQWYLNGHLIPKYKYNYYKNLY